MHIAEYHSIYSKAASHELQLLTGCIASCRRRNYKLVHQLETEKMKPTNDSRTLELSFFYSHGEYESRWEVWPRYAKSEIGSAVRVENLCQQQILET